MHQEHWWFDWDRPDVDSAEERDYWCRYASIIRDPRGNGIRSHLKSSYRDKLGCYLWKPLLDPFARRQWKTGLDKAALLGRFMAVIQNGFDPWEEDQRQCSVTDLAQGVNQLETWLEALRISGWDDNGIDRLVRVQTLYALRDLCDGLKYLTIRQTVASILFDGFKVLCERGNLGRLSEIVWDAEYELRQSSWGLADIILQERVNGGGPEALFDALYVLVDDRDFWEDQGFHQWRSFLPRVEQAAPGVLANAVSILNVGLTALRTIV